MWRALNTLGDVKALMCVLNRNLPRERALSDAIVKNAFVIECVWRCVVMSRQWGKSEAKAFGLTDKDATALESDEASLRRHLRRVQEDVNGYIERARRMKKLPMELIAWEEKESANETVLNTLHQVQDFLKETAFQTCTKRVNQHIALVEEVRVWAWREG